MKKHRISALAVLIALGCGAEGVGNQDDAWWMQQIDIPSANSVWQAKDAVFARDLEPESLGEAFEEDDEFGDDLWANAGEFGYECEDADDCLSGLCMDSGTAFLCSASCVEECPAGWHCQKLVVADSLGATAYCVPNFVPYCRPCQANADCERYQGDVQSTCYYLAKSNGRFCTTECETNLDCAEGSMCGDGVCRPSSGECDCTGAATNIGFLTGCSAANEHGSCDGQRSCTEDGLTKCDAPVPEADLCDGADNNCNGQLDEQSGSGPCVVTNEWGSCKGLVACVDGATICGAPTPEPEACDGKDNDCDGDTDGAGAAGCGIFYLDVDQDGFGGQAEVCLCSQEGSAVSNSLDCDDIHAATFPGAEELCDAHDNDCDGDIDDGCDGDGDGYCSQQPVVWGPELVCKFVAVDCNDKNELVNPGNEELCDGIDNDCDGQMDEECDLDGDGYCGKQPSLSGPDTACSSHLVDCDDLDPTVHPETDDLCNGKDDDCSGIADQDCDADNDGYCAGIATPEAIVCGQGGDIEPEICEQLEVSCPAGFNDCADEFATVNPGTPERCNGQDDDCDGQVDEWIDADGDGYCLSSVVVQSGCSKCIPGAFDCNDGYAMLNPGAVDEPDLLGVDTNCDGVDGVLAKTVFVNGTGGMDSWPGTISQPKQSVQAGLDEAYGQPEKEYVLVARGTYKESLELRNGVKAWGGFDPAKGWSVSPTQKTVLQGGPTAVQAVNLTSYTVLGRMDVQASDGTVPGENSVGVQASGSPGLALSAVNIHAGKGAAGKTGHIGGDGCDGKKGGSGISGCYNPSKTGGCYYSWTDNTCPGFASGGMGTGSYTDGGRGDGWGDIPQEGAWDAAVAKTWDGWLQGEPSECYKMFGPAKGGAPGKDGDQFSGDSNPGTKGGAGVAGGKGAKGEGGKGGKLDENGWIGDWGIKGSHGVDGCGGGGGGMGGTNVNAVFLCDAYGGGGGGGGAGGHGGWAGHGGQAGGGSIGVVLHQSPVSLEYCNIYTLTGGKGGPGGQGGLGGAGAYGGKGGAGYKGSGKGGDGGNGASGGRAGGGGGGAGGVSAGIVVTKGFLPTLESVSYSVGQPGAGGKAGNGGIWCGSVCDGKKGQKQNMLVMP